MPKLDSMAAFLILRNDRLRHKAKHWRTEKEIKLGGKIQTYKSTRMADIQNHLKVAIF